MVVMLEKAGAPAWVGEGAIPWGAGEQSPPGDTLLSAVGRSENLNILPGGFFANLLLTSPPSERG